jgi:hypothetical protein
MGQYHRENMTQAELYRPPPHYPPSGYGAPQNGAQIPSQNYQQRPPVPQAYPPQGYQNQGYRSNSPEGGIARYPVPTDAYNPRAGFVRGPAPYRDVNHPPQLYPSQPPAAPYGMFNGPNQSRPPMQDYRYHYNLINQ